MLAECARATVPSGASSQVSDGRFVPGCGSDFCSPFGLQLQSQTQKPPQVLLLQNLNGGPESLQPTAASP